MRCSEDTWNDVHVNLKDNGSVKLSSVQPKKVNYSNSKEAFRQRDIHGFHNHRIIKFLRRKAILTILRVIFACWQKQCAAVRTTLGEISDPVHTKQLDWSLHDTTYAINGTYFFMSLFVTGAPWKTRTFLLATANIRRLWRMRKKKKRAILRIKNSKFD